MGNRLGVQGYTIREFTGTPDGVKSSLEKIKAIGYDTVQLGIPACMTLEAYKAALDDVGLRECIIGTDAETILQDPQAIVDKARYLDVDIAMLPTIPEDIRTQEKGYRDHAQLLNRAGAALKSSGIRVAYHNHALEFCNFGGYTGMDILIDDTDPETVMLMLDTHWLTAGGVYAPKWIRRVKGRIPQVHFKDYGIDFGQEVLEFTPRIFAEVGRGNLDWDEIVAACREAGSTVYIVEQDICKGSPFDSLAISFSKLKELGL